MKLALDVQIRPTRIGLLVAPDDETSISRFQRLCTCLWGGALNPIIPVSDVVPERWRKPNVPGSGVDLARRYLEFFEPDVLVEATPGLAERVGYGPGNGDTDHILALDALFSLERGDIAAGLLATDAYAHRHDRESRFVQRDPSPRVMASEDGEPHYAELVWGAFPNDPALGFVRKAYETAFAPVEVAATAEAWVEYQRQGAGGPFMAGLDGVDLVPRDDVVERYFIFDPADPLDRIDFWNLRLFRAPVRGVPLAWLPAAEPVIRQAIADAALLSGSETVSSAPTTVLEFSESLSSEKVEAAIRDHFDNLPPNAVTFQTFYDRPRKLSAGHTAPPQRLDVEAGRRSLEVVVDDQLRLGFDTLSPPFKVSHGFNAYRWINILGFPYISLEADIATLYPLSAGQRGYPAVNWRQWSRMSATREGLLLPQWRQDERGELELQTQGQAVRDWVQRKGFKAEPSGAGRIAQELLRALGGPWGAYLVSDPAILKLLDGMAASQIEHSGEGEDRVVRRFEGKTASVSDWRGLLNRLAKEKDYRHEVSAFVERNILKLGLSARCAFCTQDNWYPLDRFGYELPCERCLRSFPLPEEVTRSRSWRYRVIGSFAVPNYADGAYSVALTLRLFGLLLARQADMTASTALEFSLDGRKVETDFLFWWRPRAGGDLGAAPHVVFGEAKSFAVNAIDARSIDGLRAIADLFPGGFAVVAKLGDRFSESEQALLRDFVSERTEGGHDTPLIVLTGRELLARTSVSATWTKAGGAHAASVDDQLGKDLRRFAELTRGLYL